MSEKKCEFCIHSGHYNNLGLYKSGENLACWLNSDLDYISTVKKDDCCDDFFERTSTNSAK